MGQYFYFDAFAIIAIIFTLWSSPMPRRRAKPKRSALPRRERQAAVVSCYAVEGSYPESLNTLQEHYGVRIDESKLLRAL